MNSLAQFLTSRGSRNGTKHTRVASAKQAPADPETFFASAADALQAAITDNPGLALGAALAAGVIIGWLIKRR
jgi:ElaB/YqjD/DUF883 family membrane-anchored ribosome-binding protein